MAAKAKVTFVCQQCGTGYPRWMGRCTTCGEWNTLVEEMARPSSPKSRAAHTHPKVIGLAEVAKQDVPRHHTGIGELDRVLGGGLVPGSVVLLGGDPGMGKSTLMLQALTQLARAGLSVLYVTGEESLAQVADRAQRLGTMHTDRISMMASSELEDILAAIESEGPGAVVVDSIQTTRTQALESASGSVGQLRQVTSELVHAAKQKGCAVFLIGHVTKEGALAGPKVLEHLVDTVLSFEGDCSNAFRLIRVTKNRFGPTHEVGVFEMVSEGLREVKNPSSLLLAERPAGASGSVIVATADGTRSLLVEVQALVAPAAYGTSRRVATGLDAGRLAILLAVLDRKAGVQVLDRDVFASIAGGVRVDERALDLALALAVVSSVRNRPVSPHMVVMGELGLAGEVRAVPRMEPRIAEAGKMGFQTIMMPNSNAERVRPQELRGLQVVAVSNLSQALQHAFSS
jgi:DNA repair protein RadA/Sms